MTTQWSSAPLPVVPHDPDQLLKHLAARGYRMTGPRRQIVVALAQRGGTTAQMLYQELRDAGTGIGRATVFRTLELLLELGVLQRVHLPDGCHSYVLTHPGHSHHLVCSDCGIIVEIDECGLDDWLVALAGRTSFRIEGHWLEIFGRCQACQT